MADGDDFFDIDGGVLEGGGQIIRNSAALSGLLNRPISLRRIRAGRKKPGLAAQHSCGLKLVTQICSQCFIEGNAIGSVCVRLRPGPIQSGSYSSDTGTAGSVCLVAQAAVPLLAFGSSQSELVLQGGTNADFAPPTDHFGEAFQHAAGKFGLHFQLQLERRGFFPRGGGKCRLLVQPSRQLQSVQQLQQGRLLRIRGSCFVCGNLNRSVAQRMHDAAVEVFQKELPNVQLDISVDSDGPAVGNGGGVSLFADTDTGCLLGVSDIERRGQSVEKLGADAAKQLINDIRSGACVDSHTQDQIVLLMSLAAGTSSVRCGELTLHTRTSIHIAELLTGVKFRVESDADGVGNVISCDGIGFKNANFTDS